MKYRKIVVNVGYLYVYKIKTQKAQHSLLEL